MYIVFGETYYQIIFAQKTVLLFYLTEPWNQSKRYTCINLYFDLDLALQELEEQLSRVDEDVKVGKAFKVKLERLEQLEKENRQLREENAYCKWVHMYSY